MTDSPETRLRRLTRSGFDEDVAELKLTFDHLRTVIREFVEAAEVLHSYNHGDAPDAVLDRYNAALDAARAAVP